MLNVSILVGNPKPRSRTLQIAEAVVAALFDPKEIDVTVIDLADVSSHIFEWPSDVMNQLTETVASSDILVAASPTYKATYTGLLKGFLDRYPNDGLRRVTAIPVMTGADLTHAIGGEVHLRPLLVELGAIVPTKALYFVTGQMDQMDDIVAAWVSGASDRLAFQRPALAAMLKSEVSA
jgi:FMN reductase